MSNFSRVFLDTNICYDILSKQMPFYPASAQSLTHILNSDGIVIVSSLTVVNLHYFLRKDFGDQPARKAVLSFKSFCEVRNVDDAMLNRAFASEMPDIEDALQHFIALEAKADAIISRDKKGFKKSTIPVYTPTDFIKNFK